MNDASAGWEAEYAFVGLSTDGGCEFPGCGADGELKLIVIGENAYRACCRHAKDLLGVSS